MESQWLRLEKENKQLRKDTISANEKKDLIDEIEDLESPVRFSSHSHRSPNSLKTMTMIARCGAQTSIPVHFLFSVDR